MNTALITLGIFIALIAGFFAGRWHGMSHRSKQLAEELEQKDEELNKLKSGVDKHFSETARLFTNLTEEYKHLYKHLAKGATELSNESFKLSLAAPNDELIEHEEIDDVYSESSTNEDETDAPQQPVDYAKPEEETSESEESQNDSEGVMDSEDMGSKSADDTETEPKSDKPV